MDPVENRYKEEDSRAQATRDLSKCISDYRMSADSLSTNKKESVCVLSASPYRIINSLNILKKIDLQIVNECLKVEQWLRDKTQEQDSVPRNMDPVIWSHDIESKMSELNS